MTKWDLCTHFHMQTWNHTQQRLERRARRGPERLRSVFTFRVWKVLVIINVLLLAALCRCTYEQAAETMVQPGKRGTSRQRAFAIRRPFFTDETERYCPGDTHACPQTAAWRNGETTATYSDYKPLALHHMRYLLLCSRIIAAAETFSLQRHRKEKKNIMPIRSAASIPPNV